MYRTVDQRAIGKRGEGTRTRLLDALLDAVKDRAWREVSVPKVAAAAEVSPAAFYQYFNSLGAAFDVLLADLVVAGDPLPVEVEAIARLRALERRRPFAYTPPPGQVAQYVARTPAVKAVQWTGSNAADVVGLVGDRFRVLDAEERELLGAAACLADAGAERPVRIGWWLVVGSGREVGLLPAEKFAAQYRAAAIEERSGLGKGAAR